MNLKKIFGLAILMFAFIMGCSGNYGKFIAQSNSDSKVTKQVLIDNWSDYNIWLIYKTGYKPPRLDAIIYDTKSDDMNILVGSKWVKVKDQEMWTQLVKEKTTSDGDFRLRGHNDKSISKSAGLAEIRGPDNQLFGFIVYYGRTVSLQRVKLVDENSVRLSWRPPEPVGQK